MTKRIAILHYASPPTVGGVESLIDHQARGLAQLGYAVRVVSGAGEAFDARVETHINPLFGSTHPDVLAVKAELDRGAVTPRFHALVERMSRALHDAIADCDAIIAHNVLSLHKNLALTAALAGVNEATQAVAVQAETREAGAWDAATEAAHSNGFAQPAERPVRIVAWCSDLAWTNPQYQPELYPGYPWDLLRQPWPGARYVTISEARREELAALFDIPPESVTVSLPGIDPARFLRWTATTDRLVKALGLLDADGLLLLPARMTRRKNIELALRVLAAIRQQSGCDFRLIVTGPPGPHNPTNPGYVGELLQLRAELGLEKAAHFLYEHGEEDGHLIPDDDTVADLYRLADALFFPSIQEGFGIPILEAGISGLPVFCADIPPLRSTGKGDVTYFDPIDEPAERIAARVLAGLNQNPAYALRGRVRRSYRWETIVREQLVPLLEH